jgi:hypothetical protein
MDSTNTKQQAILEELYFQAFDDQLAWHGTKTGFIREAAGKTGFRAKPAYVSALGASGEGIAIMSILKIDRDLLTSLHPLGSADISQLYLEDWCRELNNQIVGRLKNKLLRYGVGISLGLPVLLSGTDVTTIAAPHLTVSERSFESQDSLMSLALSTILHPDLEFLEQPSSEEESALLEGSLALF